jgi:hypothetical protein
LLSNNNSKKKLFDNILSRCGCIAFKHCRLFSKANIFTTYKRNSTYKAEGSENSMSIYIYIWVFRIFIYLLLLLFYSGMAFSDLILENDLLADYPLPSIIQILSYHGLTDFSHNLRYLIFHPSFFSLLMTAFSSHLLIFLIYCLIAEKTRLF